MMTLVWSMTYFKPWEYITFLKQSDVQEKQMIYDLNQFSWHVRPQKLVRNETLLSMMHLKYEFLFTGIIGERIVYEYTLLISLF